MLSRNVEVKNKAGIHARPASMIMETAGKYKAQITLTVQGKKASAKSLIQLLALSIKCGAEVGILAHGEGEEEALEEMAKLFDSQFGEE